MTTVLQAIAFIVAIWTLARSGGPSRRVRHRAQSRIDCSQRATR